MAAATLKAIMATTPALRVDTSSFTNPNALRAPATGRPRSGFPESAKTRWARCRRSACRACQRASRTRGDSVAST
jgi:hypothetical protein